MKRLALASLLLAATACGGGDSGSDWTATSAVDALVSAGLCSDPFTPEPDEDDLDVGLEPPSEERACITTDTGEATIGKYASDDAVRALAAVAAGFYEAFGLDPNDIELALLGDGLVLGVDESDDLEAANEWTRRAAEELGADVKTIEELRS